MRSRLITLLLLTGAIASAVVIDRIAIIIDNKMIVKDSDIRRDIRVTSFLNNQRPDLSPASQKQAANRLIDQIFIRREIELGGYPQATLQQADQQLDSLEKERFRSQTALNAALRSYSLNALDLRFRFQWQLTVLRFINSRFKPAVLISDDEIEKYYRDHAAELRRQFPGRSSLNDLRDDIRDLLTDERVNQQFFAWLDAQRKDTKIQYLEADLR
ncbi:MAG: hypothetical protein JOY62_12445 [Acidobacteriaceae bacterium]|nr:hypothetical protein [Acidobacteriaceae bacterium]MBV9780769.1 hypothetical protein [Acidobacteriaceae bacterium]